MNAAAMQQFERQTLNKLSRLRTRLRSYLLIGGVQALVVGAFVAATIQLILDYTFRLPLDMRAALLGVILVVLGYVGWTRIYRPLALSFGLREMAGLVERNHPQLRSVLVSAVQFASGDVGRTESNSPELIGCVIEQANRETSQIPFTAVLNHSAPRRGFVTITLVLLIGLGALALRPRLLGLWFDRNILLSDSEWPKRTLLKVHLNNGVLTGARGDDLQVRASAEGVVPRNVDIIFDSESDKSGRETMVAVGEHDFRYTFTRVDEPFRFKLKGGDDETAWFQVILADRPRVEDVTINVTPPAYAGIDPFTLPAGQRAFETLRGSHVDFNVKLNKPVKQAVLMAGQSVVQQARGGDDQWSVSFEPVDTRTYHFHLVDELDLENKRPLQVSIRTLKDEPPRVRMKIIGVSDVITPQALLPIEVSVSDTFGLSKAEMVYKIGREGSEPETVQLPDFKTRMKKFDAKLSWPVAAIELVPGDRLTLSVRAADFDDISGPNESQSAPTVFRVISTDELLAELARREQEYRQEFERVIQQQERLRSQLLTLIRTLDDDDVRDHLADRVAPFERRQRQITGQVNLLRQQFAQVLAEMAVNGLDTANAVKRLQGGIISPLTRLAKRDLVSAGDLLRAFGRTGDSESAAAADDAQASALADMRRILSNMLKWEGFQEAVTMLREIMRLQAELSEETQEELERRATELLEGG